MRILLLFGLTAFLFSALPESEPELTPFNPPRLPHIPRMPVSAENPVSLEGADLGRHLFYDPVLSRDSTVSCASCHKQEYAFSDAGNQLSRGFQNQLTQRNTPGLFNLAWYPAMFWDGRAVSIESQVFVPVSAHNEMNLDWPTAEKRIQRSTMYQKKFSAVFGSTPIDSTLIAYAIAQFERTLLSFDSKFDRVVLGKEKLTPLELRGFEIMNDQSMANCMQCHSTDANGLATNRRFANNGLQIASTIEEFADAGLGKVTGKAEDYGKFKVPSLRNIALTAPYMHDGRFETLEEVVDFYSEGVHKNITTDSKMIHAASGGVNLTEEDKEALISFLHTLTDSTFINNPSFGNPFTP